MISTDNFQINEQTKKKRQLEVNKKKIRELERGVLECGGLQAKVEEVLLCFAAGEFLPRELLFESSWKR